MITNKPSSLLAVAVTLIACVAARAQTDQDKSRFTLFDPTPRSLRRPLSADRPDATESPYTVDAGAVQLEMSFLEYATSDSADEWNVAPINLKFGLAVRNSIPSCYLRLSTPIENPSTNYITVGVQADFSKESHYCPIPDQGTKIIMVEGGI